MALEMGFNVEHELIERYIDELAKFGADGATGVRRTAYSPEWVAATDQYAQWCAEAGLEVRRDAVGNVWGRLEGSHSNKVIASGSHIDSQLPGGKYDGALGALAALCALRLLKEKFGMPKRSLEAVAFCEEEGSRFPAANLWGSRAVAGRIAPTEAEEVRDYSGATIGSAMRAVGLDPDLIPEARRSDIDTFIELHIEQGPILEHASLPVGIVTGITGLRHYVVEVTGEANHAGAFPMDLRHDPMAGAAEMIQGVIDTAVKMGRPAVTTVGRIQVEPNFPAIIPQKATFTIDARHPDPQCLKELYAAHETLLRTVAERRGLQLKITTTLDQPACPSDAAVLKVLQSAAQDQDIPYMMMHSGAGHDSQVMANISKVAMIFVQSHRGRSHTPDEFSTTAHIVSGIQTLMASLYRMAYL